MTIEYQVQNQRLTLAEGGYVVENAVGYVQARFAFTDDWQGLYKTAVFERDELPQPVVVLLLDDCCNVPSQVLTAGVVSVSVFGVDVQDEVSLRITTNKLTLTVNEGGALSGVEPEAETPDIYAQILTLASQAHTAAIEAQDSASTSAAAAQTALLETQKRADVAAAQAQLAQTAASDAHASATAAIECATAFSQEKAALEEKIEATNVAAAQQAAVVAQQSAASAAASATQAVETVGAFSQEKAALEQQVEVVAGATPFVVTMTSDDWVTFYSDKTCQEIYDAHYSGRVVMAVFRYQAYYLEECRNTQTIMFARNNYGANDAFVATGSNTFKLTGAKLNTRMESAETNIAAMEGQLPYRVTFTYSSTDNKMSSDKQSDEIREAIETGRLVYAIDDGRISGGSRLHYHVISDFPAISSLPANVCFECRRDGRVYTVSLQGTVGMVEQKTETLQAAQ